MKLAEFHNKIPSTLTSSIPMKETLNVIVLSENQLRQLITETVDELLIRRIPEIMRRANRKEYITSAEFKDLTGCSYRVQAYLRAERRIPFTQYGRKIIYKTTDVEKYIDENRIAAISAK